VERCGGFRRRAWEMCGRRSKERAEGELVLGKSLSEGDAEAGSVARRISAVGGMSRAYRKLKSSVWEKRVVCVL
jgi:hypothetical protein